MKMDKRKRIIEAAISVFRDKGLERATVSDIVKQAGIAQGTYYLYFPSRLSVMSGIAEVFAHDLLTRIQSHVENKPPAAQVEALIDAIFEVTEENSEIVMLLYSGLTQTEDVRRWEEIYGPVYAVIQDVLEHARDSGVISPELDTSFSAKILIGTVESAAEQIFLYSRFDAERIRPHLQELRRFIHGGLGLKAGTNITTG